MSSDSVCSICYEAFTLEHRKFQAHNDSPHYFHFSCLQTWFQFGNNSCPLCRENISLNEPTESDTLTSQIALLSLSYRREGALKGAAFAGDLVTVLELLEDGEPFNHEEVAEAVKNASARGHLEIVNLLLNYCDIGEDGRGIAVIHATQKNHPEILFSLFANGFIPESYSLRAIEIASCSRNSIIIDILRNLNTF